MPKRQHEEDSEQRYLRKLNKYKEKLLSKKRKHESRRIIYSSEEEGAEIMEHWTNYEVPDDTPMVNLEHDELTSHMMQDELTLPINLIESDETMIQQSDQEATAEVPSVSSVVNRIDNENEQEKTVDEDIYDTDLLRALGSFDTEEVVWGSDLHDDISKRLQFILQNGLKKETKEELCKKYLFPNNTQFTKAPTLNPEVISMLTETYRNRDKLMVTKQNQLGRALSALGNAMTSLIKKNPNITNIVRTLNDCAQMIADSHYSETYTRRSLIIPLVEKSLIDPLKDTKRDNYLFGEKLADLVKNSKGIKKTGNMIQAGHLNWRGPSNRGRYKYQQTSNKSVGQRTQQFSNMNRRRFPPPPPPGRRAAPPPPPPQQAPSRRQLTQTAAIAVRRPPYHRPQQ